MATSRAPPPLSLSPQFLPTAETSSQAHENDFYRDWQAHNDYSIREEPVFTKRPLRMIIIGAGAAGLQIAYKAERQLENVTWQIYEKNNDVGGTWLENRYPGCTCDIPSHAYQWTFWRNPEWSAYYSGAKEIWKYLKSFAVEFGLEKYVKFEHKVEESRWNETDGLWEVTITRPDGTVFVDKAEILASCHGVLNTWKWPDVPGVQDFEGKMMHSAMWDDTFELSGKTVAVIGGGSSAVQIIPAIQSKVKKLVPYLRSSVWVTAGFGAKYAAPGGGNFEFSEQQKTEFREDEPKYDQYCRDVEGELNKRFTLMHLKSVDQKNSRDFVKKSMEQQLGHDPTLTKALIPDFALGCRRMTPGADYLESLRRENVQVITDSVARFTKDSIIDESGRETKVDVIICATGFDVSAPAYSIVGKGGRTLKDEWKDYPKAYLSIMAADFPNMFLFIGPNGPASHGSILPIMEWHTRYMFKVLTHVQQTSIKAISPSPRAIADLHVYTHTLLARTAWSSACRSWFKGGKTHGPVTMIWPGSRMHYFEVLKEPRYEDMEIEYLGNRFEWLGNGYTQCELDMDGNPVWYFDVLRRETALGTRAYTVLGEEAKEAAKREKQQ